MKKGWWATAALLQRRHWLVPPLWQCLYLLRRAQGSRNANNGIAVLKPLVSSAEPTGIVVTMPLGGIVVYLRAIPVRKIWHIGRPELFNILLFFHVALLDSALQVR